MTFPSSNLNSDSVNVSSCFIYGILRYLLLFLPSDFQSCSLLSFVTSSQFVLLLHTVFYGSSHQNILSPHFFSVKFLCKPCSLCSWAVCVQLPLFRAELPEDFPTGLFPTLDPSWSLFPPRSFIIGPISLRVCLEHHHHYLCSGKVTVTTQPI